jgi:hypothetical protein
VPRVDSAFPANGERFGDRLSRDPENGFSKTASGTDLIPHLKLRLWERVVSPLIFMICWTFIAYYVSPLDAQEIPFTRDFEGKSLWGWKPDGLAFEDEPVNIDTPLMDGHSIPSNHQGKWWVDSNRYLPEPWNHCTIQGDELTGSLASKAFTIRAGTLTFLVGGDPGFETRVELIILNEGAAIDSSGYRALDSSGYRAFFASGRNSETMREVSWNLNHHEGDQGYIRMVDDSSRGHINADHFQFISPPPHPCEVAGADPMHCEPPGHPHCGEPGAILELCAPPPVECDKPEADPDHCLPVLPPPPPPCEVTGADPMHCEPPGHPHCGEPGAIPELCAPPPGECDKPEADPDHCLVPPCEGASCKQCDFSNKHGLEKIWQIIYCYWLWFLLLLLISIVTYLFYRLSDNRAGRKALPKGKITYEAYPGPGKASIGPGSRLDLKFELRLRCIKDAGVQRASPPNDLVKNESREP